MTKAGSTGKTGTNQPQAKTLFGFVDISSGAARYHAIAFVLAAALGVSGCVGGANKVLDTYDLGVPEVQQVKRLQSNVQILIAEPQALKILDGENIVVREGTASVAYLTGAQWTDRLPKVVQARMVQAFENSGRFGGVGRPGEGLAIDYQILTDIRAFEINSGAGSSAVVKLFVKLMNDRNGEIIASRLFEARSPSAAGNSGFVNALDAAFSEATADIIVWVSATL